MKALALALSLAPLSALAFPIDSRSFSEPIEVVERQEVFSKFKLAYSLECGLSQDTVSDFRLTTGDQTRALITGRAEQPLTIFGFGPLTLSLKDSPAQGQQKQDEGCSGELTVVSVEPVSTGGK